MFKKKIIGNFIILLLPMLGVSTLLNFLYTLNSHDKNQINLFVVVVLAIVLDAFFTWMQMRKNKEKKSE